MDMGCGCATVLFIVMAGALGIDRCQEKVEQGKTERRIAAVNDSAEAYARKLSPQTRSLVERLDSIESNAEYLGRLAERAHAIVEQNPDVADVFSTHEENLSSLRDSLVVVGNTIQRELRIIYLARQMQEAQGGLAHSDERARLLRAADNLLGAAQAARERQTRAMIGNPEDYRHD